MFRNLLSGWESSSLLIALLQFFFVSSLIIVIFVVLRASADNESDLKCLVSYLRQNGINEEILSSVESAEPSSSCSQVIDSNMQILYARVNMDSAAPRYASCYKSGVENTGLKNAFLLAEAMKRYDVGWKLWKDSARVERANQLIGIVNNGVIVLNDKCNLVVSKGKLEDEFDRAVVNPTIYRGDQEFCVRKHLISTGLLGNDVIVNPQAVNEMFVDCSFILSSLKESLYQKVGDDCKANFFRQESYLDHYLKVQLVLPRLKLTPEALARERMDFTEKILSIIERANKLCSI